MTRITNLATLKAAIAQYAIRTGDTDFENSTDLFVQGAEQRMSGDLRVRQMERFSSGICSADGYVTLPADYLSMRQVFVSTLGADALDYVPPDLYAAQMNGGFWNGSPSIGYTVIGDQMRAFPASNGTYTMIYYQQIPALTDLAPSNWLLVRYPMVYLYASLLEAAPFMEEDQRSQTWKAYYDAAISGINRDDTRSRYGSGVMRVSQDTP